MKFKLVLLLLVSVLGLTGCGIKKAINTADEVVKDEKKENEKKQVEWEVLENANLVDEELTNANDFPVILDKYIEMQKNLDSEVVVKEEKTGNKNQFRAVEVEHSKGNVIESLVSIEGSELINSYSIDVIKKDEKSNGALENGFYAENIISNFLQDAKVIDKPLNLVVGDIDLNKELRKDLTEKMTLVISPQPNEDGAILSIQKKN